MTVTFCLFHLSCTRTKVHAFWKTQLTWPLSSRYHLGIRKPQNQIRASIKRLASHYLELGGFISLELYVLDLKFSRKKQICLKKKNYGFPSLSLSFSFQAAGQPTTLWRSTEKHKVHGRNPILDLTRLSANHVLHSVSGSLHSLHLSNQWRFIMGPNRDPGTVLKEKNQQQQQKKKHSSCLCHLMWVKSGFDWSTYHHRLFHHHAAWEKERERLFWGGGHVEKKTQ